VSGSLTHSPAKALKARLVELGLGAEVGGTWPIYVNGGPDTPDAIIVLQDREAQKDGRDMNSGQVMEHFGVQVLVRHGRFETGFTKARAIAVALDESIRNDTVTIGSTKYHIYAVSRKGSPISTTEPGTKRSVFSINAVIDLRQTV